MAGMTSLVPDQRFLQVLSDIQLIPQLYEEFITSHERTVLCLPHANYSRSLSFQFLTFVSEFYCGLLRRSDSARLCSICGQLHGLKYVCLPNFRFIYKGSLDLLLEILEWRRGYLSFADDLVSLVQLCGYLLIKKNVVHAFLLNLLPLDEVVKASKSGAVFVYELYRNGFLATSEFYAEGIDHPSFYSLLETYPNFRDLKRKLRSFHRYRHFARTYSYPSGRVKFSRVRAAAFWDYFQPPESLDYPDWW